MLLNQSGPARSRAVPRMLMRGMPCERAKLALSDDMRRSRRHLAFDERGVGEGQAHGSLACDSFGAEPTVMIIFGRKYLSIKHAAPKEDG